MALKAEGGHCPMTDALSRLIPLLEKDVVATLGEPYRHMVRAAVKYLYYEGG